MAEENVGAERWRQKNNEVGKLYTCFRSSGSPVTNLVTEQSVRAMRHLRIWYKRSLDVRARILCRKFQGAREREVHRRYHAGQ